MAGRKQKIGILVLSFALGIALCACGIGRQEDTTDSSLEQEEVRDLFRVGIVQETEEEMWAAVTKSVQRELYVRGKNAGIRFDYKKYTEVGDGQKELLDEIGQDFLDGEVDAIIAIGPLAAKRMKVCTKDTGIPVVFAITTDPVEEGLLPSAEHPEGNITGAADIVEIRPLLQMMLAADSDIEQVGLLYDDEIERSRRDIAEAKRYLSSKGIDYAEQNGSDNDSIFSAAYALVEEGVDAVLTPSDPTVLESEQSVYQLFIDAGVPHYGGAESFASQGAFLGYGANCKELGIAAADMAADIILENTAIADLPVRMMDAGIATVNTETAESIGVNVDSIRKVFRSICGEVASTKTAIARKQPEEETESADQ